MFGGARAGSALVACRTQAYPQGDYVIKNTVQIPQITAPNWILSVVSDRIKI